MTASDPDIGLQIVWSVFDGLGVDEEWSTLIERGFRWWPHRASQRVWSDPPELHPSGDTTWVLHAEVVCAETSSGTAESLRMLDAQLSDFGRRLSMTAIHRDDGRVVLHATAVVHEGSADWVRRVFQVMVLSQARVALKAGTILSAVYDVTTTDERHPTSGGRSEPDEVLAALDHPPPVEQDWSHAEFGRTAEFLTDLGVLSTAGIDGLTAEFPLSQDGPGAGVPGATTLFTAEAEEVDDGCQLRLTLRLPRWPLDEEGAQRLPVDLNVLEAAGESGAHLIGSWAADFDDPDTPPFFVSILPPLLFEPGLLTNLVLAMGVRARWVSQFVESPDGLAGGFVPDLDDEDFRAGFLEFLSEHLAGDDSESADEIDAEVRTDELIQQVGQRIRALGPDTITTVIISTSGGEAWVSGVWAEGTSDDEIEDVEIDWSIRDLRPMVTELVALIGGSFTVQLHADGTTTRGLVL